MRRSAAAQSMNENVPPYTRGDFRGVSGTSPGPLLMRLRQGGELLSQEAFFGRRIGVDRPFFPPGGGEDGLLFNQNFGLGHLNLAEDVVQDALCRALEVWPVHGLPDNPSAWLMRVARNRAIDLVRREEQFRYFAPELVYLLRLRESQPGETPAFEKEIQDDQLRMMFSCCHPELSTEAQVTLILKTLCGFSVSEIAHALLASEDSIEKRLGRARKVFRRSKTFVEIANASEIPERLEAVYQAIYLLFNEGYHGSHPSGRCARTFVSRPSAWRFF